jgi:hypothetical protein
LTEDCVNNVSRDDGLPHTQWNTTSLKQIYREAAALCTYRICCGPKIIPCPELRVGCSQISDYFTGPVHRVEAGSITQDKEQQGQEPSTFEVMVMDRLDKPQVLVA